MKFAELVEVVSKESGVQKGMVDKVIRTFFSEVTKAVLEDKKEVRILNYGKFIPYKSKRKVAVNPRTREKMAINVPLKVRFVPYSFSKKPE